MFDWLVGMDDYMAGWLFWINIGLVGWLIGWLVWFCLKESSSVK